MKKICLCLILSAVFFINISGCVPLIVGGVVGALGGYAVSRDTIQAETDIPYEALWDSALTISRNRGTITRENPSGGQLDVNIDSSRVWIKLIRLTHETTRLRVSARKHALPNISLAQDLFVRIMEAANDLNSS